MAQEKSEESAESFFITSRDYEGCIKQELEDNPTSCDEMENVREIEKDIEKICRDSPVERGNCMSTLKMRYRKQMLQKKYNVLDALDDDLEQLQR